MKTLVLCLFAARALAAPVCRCSPSQPCWPNAAEWQQLGARLHGRLERAPARPSSQNPYLLEDAPGGTLSAGWLDAWTAQPSAYAVVATDASDVALAVDFARTHDLRLVIKGTGHDYLGRSSAPNSLLVWTHEMRKVSTEEAFVPSGCATAPVPAVSLGAGARWLDAYEEVVVKRGRYVQGGGCTSVGAAGGFLQGGGFGSFSKQFGIAAGSLLEAEVITADGKRVIANACTNPDLYWALKGGGGGTFGVVTRVTLKTHPLPSLFCGVSGEISARDDAAFRELVRRFLVLYHDQLADEHWGEQVKLRQDRTLVFSLVTSGLTKKEAQQRFEAFHTWAAAQPALTVKLSYYDLPPRKLWDYRALSELAPKEIQVDPRSRGSESPRWWWSGDSDQVDITWYAYRSRWVPLQLFEAKNAARFAGALVEAAHHHSFSLQFNKGQAGAEADAVLRDRDTAMNPAVLDAAALIICADGERAPRREEGVRARRAVEAAMSVIDALAPDAGTYVNEADWFEHDWQRSFWGKNYERLLQIKRTWDPDGLFTCHHCVGSERWSADGMCRVGGAR